MEEENKPQIPRLETPQTQHIRASYPTIEYLENDYIADWLKERKDQLLELAREERSGINANKLVSGAVLATGFFFHAMSPLASVGVVLGVVGYIHGCFIDKNTTGCFSLIPFVRGNILDLAGTLGNADLRDKATEDDLSEFDKLQHYLSPIERKEYHLLDSHFSILADYLMQVEPLKRFHAYRWILDCFIHYKGALPTPEQVNAHMVNVTADIRVDSDRLNAIDQRRAYLEERKVITPMPQQEIKYISDEQMRPPLIGSETKLNAINVPSTPIEDKPTNSPNIEKLLTLPLKDRATVLIKFLKLSGFDVAKCIQDQITVIAGNQRGGKGTLMAILAILSKGLEPTTKIHYFTAGDDIYPFQCDRLVCRLNFPRVDGTEADRQVAKALYTYLKAMDNATQGEYDDVILVIDEAVALSGYLDADQKEWMVKYLLTRASKKGAQIFIVLHGKHLSTWVGKSTNGMADTFKNGVSFVGCESSSIQVSALKKISVATGRYFLADADSFDKPIKDGEVGMMPEWMKSEKHPVNGQPDPARTLLKFFPEFQSDSKNPVESDESESENDTSFETVDIVSNLESLLQLEAKDVELQEDIDDTFLERILEIVSKSPNEVTSFNAIRISKSWEREWHEKQPATGKLRRALSKLIENERLEGNQETGYRLTSKK